MLWVIGYVIIALIVFFILAGNGNSFLPVLVYSISWPGLIAVILLLIVLRISRWLDIRFDK